MNTITQVSITWAVPSGLPINESATIQTGDFGPLVHYSNITVPGAQREAGGLYTCTVNVHDGVHVLDVTATETITTSVLGENLGSLVSLGYHANWFHNICKTNGESF